jgi:glycerol-3-phosphate acyltransferase PlsX
MRIALDAMGSDHGCRMMVAGAKLALEALPSIDTLFLVGREPEVRTALAQAHCHDPRIQVVHASEVLCMDDKPVIALRRKKDCSMLRAIELVKDGKADAVISTGNTGGLIAAATIRLRPLACVERAAIATVIPSLKHEFVLLDAGANLDCRPIHLVQFAVMGSVYAREILGRNSPRVGILSNGTEATKGNELTQETLRLCGHANLNCVGYVEGHDLFSDHVEVVVADGFVGNIVLKTCEGMGKAILQLLRRELTANPLRKFGATLARGAFRHIKQRMDPDAYGGAPLLGLNGNVIKAHGSARERAVMNAIRVATESVRHRLNDMIVSEVSRANERLASVAGALPPMPATA